MPSRSSPQPHSPSPQYSSEHELTDQSPKMSTQRSSSNRSSNFSPPPPISASVYRPTESIRINRNAWIQRDPDDVVALRRQEQGLEEELQELLDAQSEGLFKVLGGDVPADDDVSSTGTSTPTLTSSLRRKDLSPDERYKAPKKKHSLRGARRGIYKAINRLAGVKNEEANLVASDLRENGIVLDQIGTWDKKRERLADKITRIEHAGSANRAQAIQREASKLESEIRQMEDKLIAMKARYRELLEEAATTENSVQSKISSYKAALDLLESDIQTFVTRPPQKAKLASKDSNFLKLPSNRRTLSLARDHWNEERAALESRSRQIAADQEALTEGAAIWKDVIHLVDTFEVSLSTWLQQQSPELLPLAAQISKGKGRAPSEQQNGDANPAPEQDIIHQMDDITGQLEYYVGLAESKSWKLLVCCIGAELEAFKQASGVLKATILGPQEDPDGQTDGTSPESQRSEHLLDSPESEPKPFVAPKSPEQPQKLFDTDDEPDPNLLLAHKMETDYESDPAEAWR